MRRAYLIGFAPALLLALAPTAAMASTTYNESVAGIETAVPTSCGAPNSGESLSSFAGVAFGTLDGAFSAAICHTPLGPAGARILGGAFTLSNRSATVSGLFTGGTVSPPSMRIFGSICVQEYVVAGTLTGGSFTARLTHYGIWDGTNCNVFFATVAGRATITA